MPPLSTTTVWAAAASANGNAKAYDHKPSMLQDGLARRPTEIATLNGGIVQAAHRLGLTAPLNEAVASLIKGLEHSWASGSGGPA